LRNQEVTFEKLAPNSKDILAEAVGKEHFELLESLLWMKFLLRSGALVQALASAKTASTPAAFRTNTQIGSIPYRWEALRVSICWNPMRSVIHWCV
jgi:hypothetical protein